MAGSSQASALAGTGLVQDFFVCDFFAAVPKHDLASMEHPIFSLSTRPDRRVVSYEHNGATLTVTPSVKGRATIFDADILIFCISQLMAALNQGRAVSRRLSLTAHDLLQATQRETSGDGYKRLRDALERLAGTRITTNIVTGGQDITHGFGLIEAWEIVRKTRAGRMISVTITLSEWLFNAVLSRSVLTLSRDYFRMRKPLERRIYELARKHCGRQKQWRIGLPALQKKCGSTSTMREFRRLVGTIVEQDEAHHHMPDYAIRLDGEMVVFENRGNMETLAPDAVNDPIRLGSEIYEKARAAAPGWDVHYLEQAWRNWMADGGLDAPRDPEKAFLGFCAKWFEKRGRP